MGAAGVMAGAAVAGGVLGVVGQKKAEKAQKQALQRENDAIEDQKRFLRQQKAEKLEIMEEEAAELFGNQASAFAANNVNLSGSALSMMIDDQLKAERDRRLVEKEFDFNIRMGGFKQEAIGNQISAINKASKWNTMSTLLGSGAQAYSASKYMGGGGGGDYYSTGAGSSKKGTD